MPKIKYVSVALGPKRLEVVRQANQIITEYTAQGFDLTLRQLYYQFVSRGLLANKHKEYKRLGDIVNDARLSGLIDWNHITDRTRSLRGVGSDTSPQDTISGAAGSYHLDRWTNQKNRVEVWIEKDALIGVIEGVCQELDCNYFSCRGYTSQSEMWAAARRLRRYRKNGQSPVVLHLGDHDPSGIDMSRDTEERLALFMDGLPPQFHRLALNMDQVQEYQPPPNPAKTTDSRYEGYMKEHGDESWELDALEPVTIADLIRQNIMRYRDDKKWEEMEEREADDRASLTKVSENWDDVQQYLEEL